jgi:hypothetical protein
MSNTEGQGEAFNQPDIPPIIELETLAARLDELESAARDRLYPSEIEGESPVQELTDEQLARLTAIASRIGDTAARLTLAAQEIAGERADARIETVRMEALVRFVSGRYFQPREVKAHLVEKGLWDPRDRFTFSEWQRRIEDHLAAQGVRTTWIHNGDLRTLGWITPPPEPEPKQPAREEPAVETAIPEEPALEEIPSSSPPLAPVFKSPESAEEPDEEELPLSPNVDPAFEEDELRMARGILQYLHDASPAQITAGLRKRAVANEVRQALHEPHMSADDYLNLIDRLINRGYVRQDLIPPETRSQRHGKVLRPRRRTEMTLESMLATLRQPHAISRERGGH